MATMPELQAEFLALNATHQRLIEERNMLQQTAADDAAFQDHAHRTRQYVTALTVYETKLRTRRQELGKLAATRRD